MVSPVQIVALDRGNEELVDLPFILLVKTVGLPTSYELQRDHYVLCKCACFIAKNIVDLSQLFIQIAALRPHLLPRLRVDHIHILRHKICLTHFDHLEGDVERNRDERGEDKDPGKRGLKPQANEGVVYISILHL